MIKVHIFGDAGLGHRYFSRMPCLNEYVELDGQVFLVTEVVHEAFALLADPSFQSVGHVTLRLEPDSQEE